MHVPRYFGRLAIAVSGPTLIALPAVHAGISLDQPAPSAGVAHVCLELSPACLFRHAGCINPAEQRQQSAVCKVTFDSRALSAAPSDLALSRLGLGIEIQVWAQSWPGATDSRRVIEIASRGAPESVAIAPAAVVSELGSAATDTGVSGRFGSESIAALMGTSPVH